jgi:hypothetical protein
VLVTGLMRRGQFERLSVLRLSSRPGSSGDVLPGVAIEVRDRSGALIDRARLRRAPLFAHGCGCGAGHGCHEPEPGFESGLVEAVLPDRPDIGEVRVVRDDAVLWTRRADDDPPKFGKLTAELEEDALCVRWTMKNAGAETDYILRWSGDGGADWEALTVVPGSAASQGDRSSKARVAVAALRPGPALIEVVAVEGLNTVVSDPVELTIPDRPPSIAILWPREGCVVLNSEPVRLWGMAVAASGESLADDALDWTLDGRPMGSGRAAEGELGDWEGEHRATLRARTAQGLVEASVTFLATCSGDPPLRYRSA